MTTPSPYLRKPSPPTACPFRVRTFGRICDAPWHATLGTYFGDAMLTVVLSGKGSYRVRGKVIPVHGGMIGMVLPGPRVGVLAADPAAPYDHYYVRFAGTEALAIAARLRTSLGCDFGEHPCRQDALPVLGEMQHHRPANEAAEPRMVRLDALLAVLLVTLDEQPEPAAGPPVTRRELCDYMERRLDAPMDLSRMAGHLGISKGHLCRLARRELGETVVSAWRRLKLERACELLRETDMSIDEVSRRTGFSSPFYFSTVFSRQLRCSPSAWRKGTTPYPRLRNFGA
ncbi:MAG: helix-turn-helix domain-containing protein [Lentisphaerae bacterium]|nr:helix-turn-helix domain-containing protein [Lentisphaerota bacterium]